MAFGGPTYLAALKLRRMLALSATWQAAVGASDAAGALASIDLKEGAPDKPRPYAVVAGGEKLKYGVIAGGARNEFDLGGNLWLYMTLDVDPINQDDDVQAEFAALSIFDQAIDELAGLAGADDLGSDDGTGHLTIVSIERTVFGCNAPEEWETRGRFYFTGYDVEWAT